MSTPRPIRLILSLLLIFFLMFWIRKPSLRSLDSISNSFTSSTLHSQSYPTRSSLRLSSKLAHQQAWMMFPELNNTSRSSPLDWRSKQRQTLAHLIQCHHHPYLPSCKPHQNHIGQAWFALGSVADHEHGSRLIEKSICVWQRQFSWVRFTL